MTHAKVKPAELAQSFLGSKAKNINGAFFFFFNEKIELLEKVLINMFYYRNYRLPYNIVYKYVLFLYEGGCLISIWRRQNFTPKQCESLTQRKSLYRPYLYYRNHNFLTILCIKMSYLYMKREDKTSILSDVRL